VTATGVPSAAWFLVTHCALGLWVASASAEPEPEPVRVQLAAAACPSPSELEDKLEPLLEAELDVSDDDTAADATVIDHGASFTVEVAGVEREFYDSARDCLERGRQAAVFIALNLKPSATVEPADADSDEAARLGLQASGELAYSGAPRPVGPGVGGGFWLEYGPLRFVFSASVLLASEFAVQSAEVAGAVRLTRVPLCLSAGYLLHVGALAFGPTLGLALDVLRLRGVDLERAQTQVRTNLGVIAAFDAQLQLSHALAAIVRVGLSAFPRSYRFSIVPLGSAGETPKLWFAASLGVSGQFSD
jgi:hypothetical protein